MTVGDFLFNGNPPPAVTTETNAGSSLPLWYSQYLAGLMNAGQQQSAQPYQPYTGQQLQGFTDLQNQAFGQIQANSTGWQPTMQSAQNMVQQGGNINPSGVQNWMSPYMSNVTDAVEKLGMRNLNENLMPALQNQFIGSGQFGSGIDQSQTEKLVRDVGQDISAQQAGLLNTGYNQAASNYLTGQQQQVGAGQQLGALAQAQNAGNIQSAGALEAAGAEQQNLGQQGLNVAQTNFQNQQQYPWLQLSNLSNILHGTQFPTSTVQTQTGPYQGFMSPSPLAQVAGAASLAKGLS